MSMHRDQALKALISHVGPDDIVVAVYQSCFDWLALNPRDLNYVAVGAMGQASSHGLGLALANPNRRVLVFDGDGSLLMNLGSLVTIAGSGVTNLYHFTFVNRTYEVNGDQPLPGNEYLDFAGLAQAAGYRGARDFDDLREFERGLAGMMDQSGPQFASLEIVPGETFPQRYDYIHSREARATFRKALNRVD
ncbi:MAG: thiamine pyrophosphate-dependent enzyme [Boseongicola sp.]